MTAPPECPYPLLVGDVYVHACDRWWWQLIKRPNPDPDDTDMAAAPRPDGVTYR